MNGIALILSFILLGFGSLSQDAPAAGKGTAAAKSTPEGLAHAKKMYGYDCAMCHGANGDGKGDIASSIKTPMKNWTDPAALSGFTDEQLYTVIQKGKDEMPPEGDRVKPDDLWNMVALVRSFAKK